MVPRIFSQTLRPSFRSNAPRIAPLSTTYRRSPSVTGEANPPWKPWLNQTVFLSRASVPVAPTLSAAIIPISLVSRFSSLWVMYAVDPFSTAPVRMARLLISNSHTCSPVCTFSAWNVPSVPPTTSSFMPSTVVTMPGDMLVS